MVYDLFIYILCAGMAQAAACTVQ